MNENANEEVRNEDGDAAVTLKVKGSKEPDYPKRVANAICWQLRDHGTCQMRAVKDEAVAASIKAIAQANKKVEAAGVVLSFDAVFSALDSSKEMSPIVIEFTVQEVNAQPNEKVEYKVSAKNHEDEKEVAKLAGAVSAMIRKGNTVILRCVGPYAIYKSVRAIVMAKGYVFANGILIESVPSWLTLHGEGKGGTDISVLAIEVRSRKA